ncbi:DUF4249 domain-containing protein [Eudoraea chungangensis]|uniref:DUF4249 domain-containing protein n=1 Tax=Eudoraea chungangensis TaxID=1481905 RepID=UPI0023EDE10C|nr:DUF4249 domain-containing protein [Eudoraea chungangensis]
MLQSLKFSWKSSLLSLLFILLSACIDPVPPEFQIKLGLIYVDALASTSPGASYINIYKTVEEFGINKNIFEQGASVVLVNETTNAEVICTEFKEAYLPPADFSANVGETWSLRIVLADGKEILSETETIVPSVPITDAKVTYNPELVFSDSFNDFVPGHKISVTFDDPANEENYYYWRYKSFEKLTNCEICFAGYFRDDGCVNATQAELPIIMPYYTYVCESDCWQIRFSQNIEIFSDEFTDGLTTTDLDIADILLYTKKNILVEVQQFSLTPSAYSYFKTLQDIVDNSGSFNAPIPAALVGNLFNPNDSEEFVLGRFTAASTRTQSVFIERLFIDEPPLEEFVPGIYEEFGGGTPEPFQTMAPCEEGTFRTGIEPADWP